MLINGSDCSIIIKTKHREMDIPYSDETLREAFFYLKEEPPIEGDGICKGIRKTDGIKGCIVTPLTINTAPLLLYLAMGACGSPVFISETKNLFKYQLNLLPMEDTEFFDVLQDRLHERLLFLNCRVQGFELRIMRNETIKLKIDILGTMSPLVYSPYDDYNREKGERFKGSNVTYKINGKENTNIYGVTLVSKKQGGTETEIWIKRALQQGEEIPSVIEDLTITAMLFLDKYEYRYFGMFYVKIKKLVLVADVTEINTSNSVLGELRYYVSGGVSCDVFTSGEENIP